MSDDNQVMQLCGEIAEVRQRIKAIPNGADADGYGPMTHIRPLSLEEDRLVERMAGLTCSTDEARRARAYVLLERTNIPGNPTQMLAHAVACDTLEPR